MDGAVGRLLVRDLLAENEPGCGRIQKAGMLGRHVVAMNAVLGFIGIPLTDGDMQMVQGHFPDCPARHVQNHPLVDLGFLDRGEDGGGR